jgi:hypothetical protein
MENNMDRWIDDFITNPQHHFHAPAEVLADSSLSNDEKRRILESWQLDAQRLAESTAENMSGGEESDLEEVSKSLLELKSLEDGADAPAPLHS